MQIIPTVYAALDPAETARAVADAFTVGGRRPPRGMVEILCGLIWHETNGHPPGFGIGNISAAGFVNGAEVSHWSGLAWRPPWFEEPGDGATDRNRELHEAMLEGHEPSAFRAYNSLSEAVASFRDLLLRRFPQMVEAAAAGDPHAFGRAYVESGYCGNCDPLSSENSIKRRIAELREEHAFDEITFSGPSSGQGGGDLTPLLVAGAVGAVALWLARRAA